MLIRLLQRSEAQACLGVVHATTLIHRGPMQHQVGPLLFQLPLPFSCAAGAHRHQRVMRVKCIIMQLSLTCMHCSLPCYIYDKNLRQRITGPVRTALTQIWSGHAQ